MNKADLIYELSKKEDLTDKKAGEIVNLVFDGFTETLKKAEGSKSGDLGVSL